MKIPLLPKCIKSIWYPERFTLQILKMRKFYLSLSINYIYFYLWVCFFMCVYICWCTCVCVGVGQGLTLGFIPLVSYIKLCFSFYIYLLWRGHHTCHNVFLEVRGQPWGDCPLSPYWSGWRNGGPQVWLQDILPAETSHPSFCLSLDRVSPSSVRQ